MKIGFIFIATTLLGLIAISSAIIFKTTVSLGIIKTPLMRQIVGWALTLLPVVLIATMVIGNFTYSKINSLFYVISVTWLPTLLYIFLATALVYIVKWVSLASGHSHDTTTLRTLMLGGIVIAAGFVTYGIVNATMPRVVNYTIDAPALSPMWSGKNIILISDTHLGVVRSQSFMKKVVGQVNALQPDLVLIAGDIIDGPVFNYARGLSPLANIKSTYGVVYTPGNHEGYNREPEKFYPAVKPLVTTLIDSAKEINGTTIVGLDYKIESKEAAQARFRSILGTTNSEKTQPTIALLHDPKNAKALMESGVSLIVSGHTHCGQFFPINLVVKSIYKEFTYGVNTLDEKDSSGNSIMSTAITTCGAGTAMSPLRLGTNPEIVVIHVK